MGIRAGTVEKMVINRSFWHNKKVLITGHTGFKGSWLCHLLDELGAKIFGFALEPPTNPAMFALTGITKFIDHQIGDICQPQDLKGRIKAVSPDIVFHLAAQPLVRYSYRNPCLTALTNVMGTVYLCEALKEVDSIQAAVMITTDKVYENHEWIWPYRENDPLGGHDPYSASKAASDIMIQSYQKSFFNNGQHGYPKLPMASVRAGNVIGGGDWSEDRLIPDMMRAIANNSILEIRNPAAVRPWQHVLEPLVGYLRLAEKLTTSLEIVGAWNFGPESSDCLPVEDIVAMGQEVFGNRLKVSVATPTFNPHEASLLKLDCTKAKSLLDWQPKWDIGTAASKTFAWYQGYFQNTDLLQLTRTQIVNYLETNICQF